MKVTSIVISALATLVAAAPAKVEEEKRNVDSFGGVGGFGGAFAPVGAFDLALSGAGLNPLAVGQFNQLGLQGFGGNAFFQQGLGVDFFALTNNFNFQNNLIAGLLASNGFGWDQLFGLFDVGFPVQNIIPLFQAQAFDIQSLVAVTQLLTAQHFFSQGVFNTGIGFGAAQIPTLDFSLFAGANFGLGSQFGIDTGLFSDFNSFNSIVAPFVGGNAGFDIFQQFSFQSIGGITGLDFINQGGFLGGFKA